MKLENLKLTITKIEDAIDKQGYSYLKCKGYNTYRYNNKDGSKRLSYNFFTSIRLYPRNQEQYEETKNRLWSQTVEKPKIQIMTEDNDLYTSVVQGKLFAILSINKYDFVKHKMFPKRKSKNKGEN